MSVMRKKDDLADGSRALCSHAAEATSYFADGASSHLVWQLPDEVPVALQFNSKPFTVMMATPADLRDFAVGLALAEGIVTSAAAVQGVLVMPVEGGITLDIAVAEADLDETRISRRTIEGRSGCGLCGVEDIAATTRPLNTISDRVAPAPDIIRKAASALKDAQPMNRFNHSVHGAAFVSHDGEIIAVREDVGRHNALDKLIGCIVRDGRDPSDGFVLMTSRCSYELVQKCVTGGFNALVTVSAPTTLALEMAKSANLYLAALGAEQSVVVFNP